MAQPINKNIPKSITKTTRKPVRKGRWHPKYGTSKLEDKFAVNILDKLGVHYERQYEAKDIKRFYDFIVYTEGGGKVLIEVDGVYYHGKGLLYEQKSPMQKHNEWVDRIKDEWARIHGMQLIRVWEDDINNNPNMVMKKLREILNIQDKKDNKKKRH